MDEAQGKITAKTPALRRTQILLFILGLGVYSYFYQAGGWNQNARFDLVRGIVEEGSAKIDRYHENTGDKARLGGHYYCDKAPGASWLAVPVYGVVHAVGGGEDAGSTFLAAASYLATVWAVSIPAAMALVMLFRLFGIMGLPLPARLAVSLAYGFGTLAFPYATLFYGHQLSASLLLIGFALLVEARQTPQARSRGFYFATGVLLGYSVVVEYPALLAVAVLGAYILWFVKPRQRLIPLAFGIALPVLALMAYHAIVFGGPLTTPYEFSTQEHRAQGFFMGLGAPQDGAIRGVLISSHRGLFYSAPWLLFALPGAAWLWRRREFRAEAAVCLFVSLLFVWLNVSLVDWAGGATFGARYLILAIPFLAVAAGGLASSPPETASRLARMTVWGIFLLAAAWSGAHMLLATAVLPEVEVYYGRPFQERLFPAFRLGLLGVNTQSINDVEKPAGGQSAAWNLGGLLGLDGRATLIPLALFAASMSVLLLQSVRRQDRGDPAGAEKHQEPRRQPRRLHRKKTGRGRARDSLQRGD